MIDLVNVGGQGRAALFVNPNAVAAVHVAYDRTRISLSSGQIVVTNASVDDVLARLASYARVAK